MFKKSKWIWKSNAIEKNSYGWFFKYVNLEDEVVNAMIHLSAHNHFKLYINKELVSGLVTPAPSSVYKDKLYLSYDIKRYLKQGINLIEVVILYLGGDGQNYVNGIPGFILEGYIKTDKTKLKLLSDNHWKYYLNTPYIEDMPFQQSRNITPVEFYDDTVELDESKSSFASIIDGYNTYHLQEIPEGIVLETIKPKLIFKDHEVMVYDLGRIISGFVKIEALSNEDLELTIRYSEDLEANRVKHHVANEYSETYFDKIKLKANKKIIHKADFTYKAFRFFEVFGNLDQVTLLDVKGLQAGTDAKIVGNVDIKDDPYINQLFEMFIHTQKNNILGQLVDCPHREQAQYLGDSLLQSLALSYNIIESKQILSKVLDDFMYAQYDDATFPFVSPGNTDNNNFNLKIPEYDLYFIELVYIRYQMDLDQKVIYKYQPTMLKLINHYLSKLDEHQKVIKKNAEWHISDWPYPTVDETGMYLTYENMLFYRVLNMYIMMFESSEDMVYLKSFIQSFKLNIIRLFKQDGLFIDSYQSNKKHQGIQAFALLNGFYQEDEVAFVLNYMIEQGFNSSIIFGRYVIEALFKFGKHEKAYEYMFSYDKGWGNIIRSKSPTMWEGFDDIESHSHAWGLYPVYFIQKFILGVKVLDNDISKVIVEPFFYAHVKEMSGSVVLNQGILRVIIKKDNDILMIDLDMPEGVYVLFKYDKIDQEIKKSGTYYFNI